MNELEDMLKGLLKGEFSSLSIGYNDYSACCYQTVGQWLDSPFAHDVDWVSEEEKQKAIDNNSMWSIQWYPDTPVGFCSVAASSLFVLLKHVLED